MRADGCQVVILLSHVGYTADIATAEGIPGIDLIVGGHSHSLLWGDGKHEGPSLDHDNPSTPSDYVWGSYPTWVSSKVQDKKVPVVQAGWGSRYAGVMQIWMKPDNPGQIESITGWPVLLGGPRSDNPVAEAAGRMMKAFCCPQVPYPVGDWHPAAVTSRQHPEWRHPWKAPGQKEASC
ncbi:Metallo-dependent phosphatase-like protein [Dunaliella salina]|uniref:Metallo-dependent phosphatase-like protein n=1 Tax=Dunaliella salina TaxID=3046 RepID=A0ABQ7GV51_DUNSA|nr:Metallo-dependent phosphatase-like protein [Dunaliella salina]|eukprot:KAF5838496.1 Metallo-dependent phosphatase-like protein [Dunaliella salina]